MRRRKDRIGKRRRYRKDNWQIIIGCLLVMVLGCWLIWQGVSSWQTGDNPFASTKSGTQEKSKGTDSSTVQTARIMAHGDLLYHDRLYMSALQEDGSYNFSENFIYVKPWIEQADLAIADYEGTISPDFPLAGYPLFNAPASVATAIQEAGYDVVDLAHNHILDSNLPGLISTAKAFTDVGISSVGVYPEGNRATAPLLIRDVNGIKVAILAYTYGFNSMEGTLTQEEQEGYLSDLNPEKMQAEIERAEKEADITIVMLQMGVEYQLEPTDEQQTLYRQMVEWGADLVFGGHPHVVEPAEVIEKDGDRKLIIYSMGNFLSNQRIETITDEVNAIWTERGVLMDVTLEKKEGKTIIKTAQAHPTWVSRVPNGRYAEDGRELYHYQTYILQDFIEGGQHRNLLDEETKQRIDLAYQEMNSLVNLQW